MENKIIRKATIAVFLCTILVCCIVIWLPYSHSWFVQLKEEQVKYKGQINANKSMTAFELLKDNTIKAGKNETLEIKNRLRIPLPEGITAKSIKVTNDYMKSKIEIMLPKGNYDFLYQNPIIGSSDWINDFEINRVSKGLKLILTMNKVVEIKERNNAQYFYLDFSSPKDSYDKILVIDVGHGGTDPGAVVGKVMEKNINLEIAKELKKLFDQQTKVKVYYTRLEDQKPTYQQRVEVANSVEADLFLSIHQNYVSKGSDSYIHGVEVLYDGEEEQQQIRTSKEFARICMEAVSEASGALSRGIVEQNDLFVLNHTKMASVIVETGYLTNSNEHEKLLTKGYQEKVAKGMYAAVMKALETEDE